MKTVKTFGFRSILCVIILFLLSGPGAFNQTLIKFKDGTVSQAVILSRSHDSLFYQLPNEPNVTRMVTMDKVDTLLQQYPAGCEKYDQYKSTKHFGTGMMIGGGVISIIGIILMVPGPDTNIFTEEDEVNNHLSTGGLVVGIGAMITVAGTIMHGVMSSKIKQCNKLMKGISFDVKYTPQEKGIKLVYRF